ncbi:MAG: helix-turn-helix domain-containing protein [Microthrixaceae bacterium]
MSSSVSISDGTLGDGGVRSGEQHAGPVVEATRRALSTRQLATVEKLLDATVDELRQTGFDGLTVRNVASRAGVAAATAYNYFSSREHLVTEVFWRRLVAMGETSFDDDRSVGEGRGRGSNVADQVADQVADRVAATMADIAMLVADEPELAAACTVAMLSAESDVKLLRDRIGLETRRRILAALGDEGDPAVLGTLEFTLSGAMLQAGMGHLRYEDLAGRLGSAARLVASARLRKPSVEGPSVSGTPDDDEQEHPEGK